MQEIRLKIGKMSCINCQNAIEKMVRKIHGVENASVSFVNSCGVFLVKEPNLREKIVDKIRSLGYEILADDESMARFKQKELLKLRYNLILSAFISITAMILMSFAPHQTWSEWLQMALGAVGVFYCGRYFYKNALKALRHGNLDMNTLVFLGSLSAFCYSMCVFLGVFKAHLYFAEASMIISFVLFGKFLEENAKFKAQNSQNSILNTSSQIARVQNDDGSVNEVSPSFLKTGDIVLVRDGELVSVDGIVLSGRAEVDMSALNGEFVPIIKQKGDEIEAGVILLSGNLSIKATKNAMDSKIELLKELIFRASNAKMPIERLVDRISAYFVAAILLIALVVFALWMIFDDAQSAFLHASAVLLISCPCALGLATPIALVLALNIATKRGILIKNPAAIELLRRVSVFVFDKTGTLSEDKLSVFAHNLAEKDYEILQKMESFNSHPIAKAIATSMKNSALDGEIESFAGRGLKLNAKNEYLAGNLAFLEENKVKISPKIHAFINENALKAPVVVYLVRDKICLGAVCLENKLRENAKNLVDFLHEKGVKSVILSGDNKKSVSQSAIKLNVDENYAAMSPENKLSFLQERQKREICAFVGDGINDAAALSLANVSFAMNGGSALAKSAGDFVLMRDDLSAIKWAFALSKKTFTIIKQNLFWAFFYNALCIPLAAGLFTLLARFLAPFINENLAKFSVLNDFINFLANFTLSPHYAALAMCFSSLCVVLNSMRLRKFKA